MLRFNFSVQLSIFLVLAINGGTLADAPQRIVGGNLAARGEFPYQVSLTIDGEHLCGGSLISNQHVLTAAHCVDGVLLHTLNVVTGTVNLKEGGEFHRVKHVFIHSNFVNDVANNTGYDIAVLTMREPIVPNKFQRSIPIASNDHIPVNATATLSGFGKIGFRSRPNSYLRKTSMTILSVERCQSAHKKRLYWNQLCAFNRVGVGACLGDSGGPLVYNGEVVGIVSMLKPCARGIPDIYTKVYSFRDFINQAILRS